MKGLLKPNALSQRSGVMDFTAHFMGKEDRLSHK